jgi:hypothetical protein
MARPPRIDLPDGLYHATSRGDGRAAIFWTDDDRLRFLSQLADNVQTAAVVLFAHVAADFHVAPEQFQMHGHRGGLAKFAAVELACRLTGLTQRDVGQRYGNVTCAAVSIIRRKIRAGLYPLSVVVERLQQNILHHPEMKT